MSQVDVDRHGPTYTVDTLSDLAAQFRDHELFFITGADALAQILSWQRVGELFALAHLVGVTRPGFRLDDAHLPDGTVSLRAPEMCRAVESKQSMIVKVGARW